MPIAPVDFISVGNDISTIGNEPAYRSSVSRAYYGAFNECKSVVDKKLPHSSNAFFSNSSHEKLSKRMLAEPHLSGWRSIGYILQDFKKERVEADYYMAATVSHADALNAIARANLIIQRLNKIP